MSLILNAVIATMIASNVSMAIEPWSFARREKEADLIIIARFSQASNTENTIQFFDDTFQQKKTVFNVLSVLKNKTGLSVDNSRISVIHFWFPQTVQLAGAFHFFAFDEMNAISRAKVLKKDGVYMLYLKNSNLGGYVPVTGHADALVSIMEVEPLSDVWIPSDRE